MLVLVRTIFPKQFPPTFLIHTFLLNMVSRLVREKSRKIRRIRRAQEFTKLFGGQKSNKILKWQKTLRTCQNTDSSWSTSQGGIDLAPWIRTLVWECGYRTQSSFKSKAGERKVQRRERKVRGEPNDTEGSVSFGKSAQPGFSPML